MAGKGNIANLKPWKPGQSGNPAGRAGTLPPDVRKERKANQVTLIRMVAQLMMGVAAAETEEKEPSQLRLAVQGMIDKAKEGDTQSFKVLMEIMVGKIPEHDYDGFSEEDLRILNRVKELLESGSQPSGEPASSDRQSH